MKVSLCVLPFITACVLSAQSEVSTLRISNHIAYFTSDKNLGRRAGDKTNKALARYIQKTLKEQGVPPYGKSYMQPFRAKLKKSNTEVNTWNVIGYLEGSDPILKNEVIVLGAHYDHLGTLDPTKRAFTATIFHGADDNASGTAALLEISEKVAANRERLKRSVLFVAFGAEEQGLLGSRFFVDNPPVSLSRIKLMINMDMVGRLNQEKQLYIGGAGTFPEAATLLQKLGDSLGLNTSIHIADIGGSDHVSFYKKNISVLGLHTGGHPQYHTPEDTLDRINLEGEKAVCSYVYTLIMKLAAGDYRLEFIDVDNK